MLQSSLVLVECDGCRHHLLREACRGMHDFRLEGTALAVQGVVLYFTQAALVYSGVLALTACRCDWCSAAARAAADWWGAHEQ